MLPGMSGIAGWAAAAAVPFNISYLGHAGETTITVTSETLSVTFANSGTKAVIACVTRDISTISSITFNGNNMTLVAAASGTNSSCNIYIYETTASSGDIVVTYSTNTRGVVAGYEMVGYDSITATDTDGNGGSSTSRTATVNVPANGGAVCIANDADPGTDDFTAGTAGDFNVSGPNRQTRAAHYDDTTDGSGSGDASYDWTIAHVRSIVAASWAPA